MRLKYILLKLSEELKPITIDQISNYIFSSQDEVFSNNKAEVITSYRLRAWTYFKVEKGIESTNTTNGGLKVGTFFNGIQKMRESGNKYGFKTTDETHMMKNMEWRAVIYLSHSKYGINKEVTLFT